MGRKNDIKYQMTEEQLGELAALQRQILSVVWKYVKPGGTLVYSTCTLSPEENEETMRWFLQEHPDFSVQPFSLPGNYGTLDAPEGMLRLYPHRVRGEGHFVACLRRAAVVAAFVVAVSVGL